MTTQDEWFIIAKMFEEEIRHRPYVELKDASHINNMRYYLRLCIGAIERMEAELAKRPPMSGVNE